MLGGTVPGIGRQVTACNGRLRLRRIAGSPAPLSYLAYEPDEKAEVHQEIPQPRFLNHPSGCSAGNNGKPGQTMLSDHREWEEILRSGLIR